MKRTLTMTAMLFNTRLYTSARYEWLVAKHTVRAATKKAASYVGRAGRPALLLALSAVFGVTATAQNPATWMHDLKPRIGYLQLNQVVLPGTHDSGTASLQWQLGTAENSPLYSVEGDIDNFFSESWCQDLNYIPPFGLCSDVDGAIDSFINKTVNPDFVLPWAQAQDETIDKQLNQGIRFLDIRPCPWPSPTNYQEMHVCHGLFGEAIQTELNDVAAFSNANPDEIIVLSISHETANGITGTLNSDLADLIVTTLGAGRLINPGVMRNAPPAYTPSSTLNELWSNQTGRVIVLYDDDAMNDLLYMGDSNANYFWDSNDYYTPWPDLDGTYVGSKGRIYFDPNMAMGPAPTQSGDPENLNLLPAVIQNLTCGKHPTTTCQSVGISDSGTTDAQAGVPQLFALQTQPTDKMDILGGHLFAQILVAVKGAKDACDKVLPSGYNCGAALSDLRQDLGFAFGSSSFLPGNLYTLDQDANAVILPNIKSWITANPALRQNLNIVLADYFEHTSNFIPDMIELNTPPQSTLSIGVPQYGCPTNCFVTSSTPFTISATDSNFAVESINYTSEGPTGQVVSPPAVSGADLEFDIAAPAVDGPYSLSYWATNNAGLWEGHNSAAVTLDNTPPVLAITVPSAAAIYPHSATLTLNYGANDGTGSGVASVSATIDGIPTVASGQPLVLDSLSLGKHTFSVTAIDKVGNKDGAAETFSLIRIATQCEIYANPPYITGPTQVTLTADLTPTASVPGAPTGKVTFWDSDLNYSDTNLGSAAVNNDQASLTVTLVPKPNPQFVKAVYAGDQNFVGCASRFVAVPQE